MDIKNEIRHTFQALPLWKGADIEDNYEGKELLNYGGHALFPELYCLRMFYAQGYKGYWADVKKKRYLSDLPEKKESLVTLPKDVQQKIDRINTDGAMAGIWDLVLWKKGKLYFVAVNRKDEEELTPVQIEFLERAVASGIYKFNFEVYEWEPA